MSQRELGFIQLPPDSTGKRSAAAGRVVIDYTSESSPNLFAVGDTIVGETSTATGKIVGIQRAGFAAGAGQLFLEAETAANLPFTINENLKIGPTTYAVVSASDAPFTNYYQKALIADQDTPSHSLKIDARGAANISFTEGAPALSSFGGLIVDEPTSVRQYVHSYDALEDQFFATSGSTAFLAYNSGERSVTLSTGSNASGAFVQRTSQFYHPYQPGTMSRVLHSVSCGDTGKTDVRRRWGLFDENNGLFFELDGTDLYAVVRSNTGGSPVDTRTLQSDWNVDKLDGTVNFDLDVSKYNLYWIDMQWLGVGVVRFGVFDGDGVRTTAHVVQNPNNNNVPYMRQATLPIRFECENINTSASASELNTVCSAVQKIGRVKNQVESNSVCNSTPKVIASGDGETPILSLRATQTINGVDNTSVALVGSVNITNPDSQNLLVRVRRGVIPSGDNFASTIDTSGTLLEADEAASGFLVAGKEIWATFLPSGESITYNFLDQPEEIQDDVGIIYLKGYATQPCISITAHNFGSNSTSVGAAVNWKEARY